MTTHQFLDEAGQTDLMRHLDDVPDVVVALAGILTDGYPQRISYEPKVQGGSGDTPLPINTDADEAARNLCSELAVYIWLVIDHHHVTCDSGSTPIGMAAWLRSRITQLAVTPGSEDATHRIGRAVKQARRAARMTIERETWRNGSVHVARNAQLNARGIEQAAKELGPDYANLTADRVRNLRRRNRIEPIREMDGELIYRLGEVMEAHRAARTRPGV